MHGEGDVLVCTEVAPTEGVDDLGDEAHHWSKADGFALIHLAIVFALTAETRTGDDTELAGGYTEG